MRISFGRWLRGLKGLIKHGGLIGIHGSATVAVRGTFEFGKGVSVSRGGLIQVPAHATLRLGDGVRVGRDAEISPDPEIVIGDFTSIQDRCTLLGHVSVGAHCVFAPNVMMSSRTHHFKERPAWLIRDQDRLMYESDHPSASPRHLQIRVEDDCWIGINAVIMRGVTVGRGSVIGANSVVTQTVAPYTVVGGSPARLIGRRLDFAPPRAISAANPDHLPYFYSGFDLRQQTIAANPGTLHAKGPFEVALDCAGSNCLRIELDADGPTVLSSLGQRREVPAGPQSVSFALDGTSWNGVLPFDASDSAGRPVTIAIRHISAES
jgi:acetyltransferase-like isoleucine patch superfamily enzyme